MARTTKSLAVCFLNTGLSDVVFVLVSRTLGTLVCEEPDMWLLSGGGEAEGVEVNRGNR